MGLWDKTVSDDRWAGAVLVFSASFRFGLCAVGAVDGRLVVGPRWLARFWMGDVL